jgi:hypothetical protein
VWKVAIAFWANSKRACTLACSLASELVGLAFPGQASKPFQASLGELVEVALDAAARDGGQARDILMRATLALEPQDLHLLLHAGMRMVIAVVANRSEDFRRKGKVTHGILECSCHLAAHYESQ